MNSVCCDLSHIATITKLCDAKKSSGFVAGLGLPKILQVDSSCYSTQIIDGIILPIAVDMVGVMFGESSMNIKPSKSVGKIPFVINADLKVAVFSNPASNLPSQSGTGFNTANKNACIRVVRKQLMQSSLCNHVAPHQSGKSSKVAASGDESPVPRRVSCMTILHQHVAFLWKCGTIKPLSLTGRQQLTLTKES
jgi:hypothetical protein